MDRNKRIAAARRATGKALLVEIKGNVAGTIKDAEKKPNGVLFSALADLAGCEQSHVEALYRKALADTKK